MKLTTVVNVKDTDLCLNPLLNPDKMLVSHTLSYMCHFVIYLSLNKVEKRKSITFIYD